MEEHEFTQICAKKDLQSIFFKNTPMLVEISAILKHVKNDLIKSQKVLWYACAYFYSHLPLYRTLKNKVTKNERRGFGNLDVDIPVHMCFLSDWITI